MTRSLLVCLLVVCAACGPRYAYFKDGVSLYDTNSAQSECEYQVRLNKTPAFEQDELIRLCMQGKGFRYTPVPRNGAPEARRRSY
jgi:hypothetical protein